MGLSDEERVQKVFWGIEQLTHVLTDPDDLGNDDLIHEYGFGDRFPENLRRLRAIGDSLWHSFLGGDRNTAFWLMGGDADNPVRDPKGAWSAAIISMCEGHQPKTESDKFWERSRRDKTFDPFDGFLDIPGLLGQSEHGKVRRAVYNVYGWSEFLSYAVRRYDDKLRRGWGKIDKAISDIQGVCFSIFGRDEFYTRAYVLNRLLEALYGGRYAYDRDPVGIALNKLYMHHDLSRPMSRDGMTAEVIGWDAWRLQHKKTPENRLVLALRIAGRRFHYDHKLKELLGAIKDIKPKPSTKRLEREFAKCKAAHEADEKGGQDRYREDAERDEVMAIHGYKGYEWLQRGKGKSEDNPG